jgi:SsrA-binding protein
MEFEAGIMLTGSEIKSLREGKVNLGDAYCFLTNGELFVKNMHIAGYKFATYNDHDPLRLRKLLLNKSELRKIESKLKDKGLTVIPFRIYINEKGKAKLMIAVAKGKKTFDKRESIKERETGRRIREGKGDE